MPFDRAGAGMLTGELALTRKSVVCHVLHSQFGELSHEGRALLLSNRLFSSIQFALAHNAHQAQLELLKYPSTLRVSNFFQLLEEDWPLMPLVIHRLLQTPIREGMALRMATKCV